LWRLMLAVRPMRSDKKGAGSQLASAAKAVLYAVAAYTTARFVVTGHASASSNQQSTDFTTDLMRHTGGRWLVGVAGVVLVVAGYLGYSDFVPALHPHGELSRAVFWGVACSLLVFGSVALGPSFDRHVPLVLKTLGDASYSVYLMHGTFINLCLGFLAARGFGSSHHVGWLALGVGTAALLGSYTYYWLVEKPLLDYCRRRTPK
jgi:peptidoglycan/LPS O-acetylase OafA/YrhL